MRYNRLENAGIDISALTVGTWAIGGTTVSGRSWGKVDKNESIKAIQAMIANGVNCIDTAPIYGSGNSEIVVGEAIKHCRDKVILGKYMRQMGIKAQWVKPWTVTTKDSDFSSELQNILDEQFNPERPNAVWCSDITYIWTIDGFVYLTSIMDLYSRKIIAWTLSNCLLYTSRCV